LDNWVRIAQHCRRTDGRIICRHLVFLVYIIAEVSVVMLKIWKIYPTGQWRCFLTLTNVAVKTIVMGNTRNFA